MDSIHARDHADYFTCERDSISTSKVAAVPSASPSPPSSRPKEDHPGQMKTGPQFFAGVLVRVPLPPSPEPAQCNTARASPKMIHSVRPISDRPVEKQPRVGMGRVIPKKFVPPNPRDMPQVLFPLTGHREFTLLPIPRFVRENDPRQFLIYADGACSNMVA
ncbi:ribonuclease H-like protein [Penicillium subrubescens]|uniref:Uncharacterized protein n=1 Tax=Penicillium subrubescens TaxID=1316194 RepID=A0A1Q5U1S9_9EURO|nr:ribonuclease H-like protein [Penicillium subrubescens]KAJ5883105.1 ribonuclease H-like protein [Penicillium subrubescens]OKP06439.1 hypothetical protein PENSUB_6429 [Penicillium subrubescens]